MIQDPTQHPRLYDLMGEAIHDLPRHAWSVLEDTLSGFDVRVVPTGSAPRLSLVRPDDAAQPHAPGSEAGYHRKCDNLALAGRRLRGVTALLQCLHVACEGQLTGRPVPVEHMVEDVLAAARELTQAAAEALEEAR